MILTYKNYTIQGSPEEIKRFIDLIEETIYIRDTNLTDFDAYKKLFEKYKNTDDNY